MPGIVRLVGGAWLGLTALGVSACIVLDPGPPPVYHPGSAGGRAGAPPRVPPGHLPPPGQCRVWLPDRPPGQQPPPGPCDALRHQVPPGGWLIQR
jgi:hypothetical protein